MYREHQENNKYGFLKVLVFVIGLYYLTKLSLFIGVFLTNIIE